MRMIDFLVQFPMRMIDFRAQFPMRMIDFLVQFPMRLTNLRVHLPVSLSDFLAQISAGFADPGVVFSQIVGEFIYPVKQPEDERPSKRDEGHYDRCQTADGGQFQRVSGQSAFHVNLSCHRDYPAVL